MNRIICTAARAFSRLGTSIPFFAALLLALSAGAVHDHRASQRATQTSSAPARAKVGVDRAPAGALARVRFEVEPKHTVILLAAL